MPDHGPHRHAGWSARPLAVAALLLMVACYVTVFVADGAALGVPIVRDAIANTAAAAVSAVPVWWLCQRLRWRKARHWWFFPVHAAGVVCFAALWYVAIGVALGVAGWMSGHALTIQFLRGPALHWEMMTALVLYFAVAASCYTVQAIRDAESSAALLHDAEVSALRAQLDPHLLFNTLHSLLELVRSGDERAEDAIDRFARVARYVTAGRSDGRGMATLRDEWQMAQDYVALESLRLGPRLHCAFEMAPSLGNVLIPALTLQPLVENAIRHGVGPRPGAGHIRVAAHGHATALTLTVEDDGLGVAAATRGSGTGLSLVRRRLEASFGSALYFVAGPRDDANGWRVVATIPATIAG